MKFKERFREFPEFYCLLVAFFVFVILILINVLSEESVEQKLINPKYSKIITFYPPGGEPKVYESAGWVTQGASCVFVDKETKKEISVKGVYTVSEK